MEEHTYRDLSTATWHQAEKWSDQHGCSPYSVHCPLHFPATDRFVFWDNGFNLQVLPTPSGIACETEENERLRETMRNLLISFAFGPQPFLPDIRFTHAERHEGFLPQIHAEYFFRDLLYSFNVCVGLDHILYIHGVVRNERTIAAPAVVRCRIAEGLETEFQEYHYKPFCNDPARWRKGEALHWEQNNGKLGDATLATLRSGGFRTSCESSLPGFAAEEYNREFSCECPGYVRPNLMLQSHQGCLLLEAELEPGESADFDFAVITAFDTPSSASPPALPMFASAAEPAARAWRELLAGQTIVDFGDERENDIFRALQLCNLQLLLKTPSPDQLQPSQGGLSERLWVWIFEAMHALRPMIALGYFPWVEKTLRFIFALQDAGCPPQGEFTSLAGAIGTTGPRWANSTGTALALAAKYLAVSHDRDFAAKFLPKMARAAQWILREVAATRREDAQGRRPPNWGLMPKACATDGDYGYIITFTDNWLCRGLELFLQLPEAKSLPEYDAMFEGYRGYRETLGHTVERLQRPDGFLPRKLTDEGRIEPKFEVTDGAFYFHDSGLFSPYEPCMRKFTEYAERELFQGFFCTPMDRDMIYIGNPEAAMFRYYLAHGEWKKAWCARQTFLQCGMSDDLFLTQERFSRTDRLFTPWQPNGSNNGRLLEVMMQSLYWAHRDAAGDTEVILLGGMAPWEWQEHPHLEIRDLHTPHGTVSLLVNGGQLHIQWQNPPAAGTRLRCPAHFHTTIPETMDGTACEAVGEIRLCAE